MCIMIPKYMFSDLKHQLRKKKFNEKKSSMKMITAKENFYHFK